jgi:hypothetical protein
MKAASKFYLVLLTILFLNAQTIAQKKEKLIGEEIWTTSNFNWSKFLNGDPIIEAKTEAQLNKEIGLDRFFGCWLWGNDLNDDVFAILEVKPKGILIVHRIDLAEYGKIGEHASYKILGSKIKFKTHLLEDNFYHIENTSNEMFLVEEYPDLGTPNKFKKIRCKNKLPNEWLN